MLNIEKYREKIAKEMNDSVFTMLPCAIHKVKCGSYECENKKCTDCHVEMFNWLLKEHSEPIELTLAEKCILESLDDRWHWIARDENEKLYVSTNEVKKDCGEWVNGFCYWGLDGFKHLFKFIKWEDEEPYNITDLLDNCEVIDND